MLFSALIYLTMNIIPYLPPIKKALSDRTVVLNSLPFIAVTSPRYKVLTAIITLKH